MTSKRYRDSDAGLAKDFGLSPDDLSFLNEMDHLVLGKAIPLDGYARALKDEFPSLTPDQRPKLIARLLADRFMPWGDALKPSAQNVARAENLVLPAAPYFMVYAKPLTYGGVAAEVARSADIPLVGGQVQERLREIVKSRHKGVRVDAQVEAQLRRPLEMGGLGLEPEKARMVMLAMNDILARAEVMDEEAYSEWLSSQDERKPAPSVPPSTPSGKENPAAASSTPPSAPVPAPRLAAPPRPPNGAADAEEDDRQIAEIASKMPKPARDTASALARSTATLLARLSLTPNDPYLARRLEGIVSTRLRDVRSRNDIENKLMRDAKVGGMGLSQEEATRVADEIESGYTEFHASITQEEQAARERLAAEQERRVAERKTREAEEHARWYSEKVQTQRLATEQGSDILARMRAAQGGGGAQPPHPVDVKERVKEEAAFGEMVQAPPVGARPMPDHGEGAPSASPASPSAPARPVPGGVRVSSASAKAATAASAAQRPRMDDVRPVRELSGPLQELEGLSLASFRRLAKTPVDAAARIRQMVDLLAQESFDRRLQGIRAWQASPLVKQYLSLVAEAFSSATPVDALLAAKRTAGQDTPTTEEFNAIVALNGQLRM